MITEGGEMGKTIMHSDIVENAGDELIEKMTINWGTRGDDANSREEDQLKEEDEVMSKYGLIELLSIVVGSLIAIEEKEPSPVDERDGGEEIGEEDRSGRREETRWKEIDMEGILFGLQKIEERGNEMNGRMKGVRGEKMREVCASCNRLLREVETLRRLRRGEDGRGREGEIERWRRGDRRIDLGRRIEIITGGKEEEKKKIEEIEREQEIMRTRIEELLREKEEMSREIERLRKEKTDRQGERERNEREINEKLQRIMNDTTELVTRAYQNKRIPLSETVVKIPNRAITIQEGNRFHNKSEQYETIIIGDKMSRV